MSEGNVTVPPTEPVPLGLRIGVIVVCSIAVIVGIGLWIFALVTKRRESRAKAPTEHHQDIEEMVAQDPEIRDDTDQAAEPPQ